jgi:hypothetical protein
LLVDATAQMAFVAIYARRKSSGSCPYNGSLWSLNSSWHDVVTDLARAKKHKVMKFWFLSSVSNKYGIGFGTGAGIIHQVVLKTMRLPGMMMVLTSL